jgi:hypothetical protein
MLFLRCSKDFGLLWKVGNKYKHQEGDCDGQDALEDEDPSPALFTVRTIHSADTVRQKTAETRT